MNRWRKVAVVPTLVASAALAQSTSAPPTAQPPDQPTPPAAPTAPTAPAPPDEAAAPRIRFLLRPFGEYTFHADLDAPSGSVSVIRAGASLAIGAPLSERLTLNTNILEEASSYSFNNATTLVPGVAKPFNDVYRLDIRPELTIAESRQLAWVIGGLVEVAGEPDVDVGDAISGGGYAGLKYQLSPTLGVFFAIGAKTRLEDHPLFLPLLGAEWKINDTLRLSSNGVQTRLTDDLRKDFAFFMQAQWDLREYRLDDSSPLPSGVVRDDRIPISLGFAWTPTPAFTIELSGGAVVWQRFTIDDMNGNRISRLNTDPAPFIRLGGEIRF